APNLTMRQKITQLTQPQACQSCHSIINPLGFSLERYDAVGKFRTTDNGHDIDAVSEYIADNGQVIPLEGPRDVALYAVASEQAQDAFIEQLFDQLVKQPWRAYGSETMKRLRDSFIASDFNIQKLVAEIALTSALHNVDSSKNSDKKHERH
ncbi:MAG: cytochrome c, partial [Verrucomicrobiales bacterium]|nr:cytochrome c [Verrucomicrobiales bacterium]